MAKKPAPGKAYSFVFKSCATALDAFRERMPKLIELAKAIAIAELEIDGQYNAAKHDVLFEEFGANGLDSQDFAPPHASAHPAQPAAERFWNMSRNCAVVIGNSTPVSQSSTTA